MGIGGDGADFGGVGWVFGVLMIRLTDKRVEDLDRDMRRIGLVVEY